MSSILSSSVSYRVRVLPAQHELEVQMSLEGRVAEGVVRLEPWDRDRSIASLGRSARRHFAERESDWPRKWWESFRLESEDLGKSLGEATGERHKRNAYGGLGQIRPG